MTPERQRQVHAWVRRTCAAQGVPVHITDAHVLDQVLDMIEPVLRLDTPAAASPTHVRAKEPTPRRRGRRRLAS